jgi:hypothetical protein
MIAQLMNLTQAARQMKNVNVPLTVSSAASSSRLNLSATHS